MPVPEIYERSYWSPPVAVLVGSRTSGRRYSISISENSQMKKTLAAVAVLGAFAGSAAAADVTLYGVIDTGLNFTNTKTTSDVDVLKADGVNKFSMASGQNSGNRWGLKGKEDLGNGLKVGFVLESGFDSDTGALSKYNEERNRIFGREANLFLEGDFGTLSIGRVGALTSGAGSYNLMNYTPFSSGWSATATKANFWLGDRDRMDNTVTYVTPSFAGLKVYAQYSFQRADAEKAGNERQNDRYVALGATYNNGPFSSALIVDSVLHDYDSKNDKDSLGVTLGASYDFEVVKLFAMGQYGKHESKMGYTAGNALTSIDKVGLSVAKAYNKTLDENEQCKDLAFKSTLKSTQGWEGYTLALGATAPVAGGTFYAQANYLDADLKNTGFKSTISGKDGDGVELDADEYSEVGGIEKLDAKNWGIAVGYVYPFSKRTSVYTFASYSELKLKASGVTSDFVEGKYSGSTKTKQTEVGFGLVHKF